MKVGDTIRFEAADSSHEIGIALSGSATFAAAANGKFFQEYTALSLGTFGFVANITLPDKSPIEWGQGAGGQGEVS